MENKNFNFQNFSNVNSSKNVQILTMVINNNIYNLNDFTLNSILLPFLLHNNKQNYFNPKKNAFIFPDPIDIDSLQLFCNFLLTPEKVDLTKFTHLKKILNVCVFFNAIEIINSIAQKNILSNLNKDNCLDITILINDFIYSENENIKNIFTEVINESIMVIAQNLVYYLNNKQNDLYALNGEIIEKIIELFFKENDNKKILNDDIRNALELLIYSRGISNDIFLLLENERKKAINNFESLFNQNKFQLQPTFTWKIVYEDIKKHNFQETTILLENLNILLISYYDNLDDSFQLAIQILNINNSNINSDNNEKVLEINKDELLNTSTAKKIKNNTDNNLLLSYNSQKSNESHKEKEKENTLINILSLCEIREINFKSHINFNGIYTKNNSRFLVCKIENFIKKLKREKNELEFRLKLYFSRNYIFPKIIEHICRDFHKYYNLVSINKIPRSAMNILLKNENMQSVKNNEKYKLSAIEYWLKNKDGYISKKYMDIFKNIDFAKIDNSTLVDFFMKNAKLISKDESLKNDIFYEIQRRFQEEYLSYYINNNSFLDKNNNNNTNISISISNYEDIEKNCNKYNYNCFSFTYDFLTRILSNLISYNNFTDKEYESKKKDEKNEIDIKLPITQRNNIPKKKISKNINIKNSPSLNDFKKNYKTEKTNKNKIIKKNMNSNSINNSNNNSNIPTSRYEKKASSNNSLSSYQINISEFSGIDCLNQNPNQNNPNINNQINIDKNEKNYNSLIAKGIKSFTPNNSKGRSIVKINNSNSNNNRILNPKPSRIQYKKGHSNSFDRFFSNSKEDKNNNLNIPSDCIDKKKGLFPNYIKNIQNDKNKSNINQSNKRYHIKNNSSKISIQYYNDKLKNNINNKNDKISLIMCKNEDILSNKNENKKNSKNIN